MADDQQGLTSRVLDAISAKTIQRNDWASIAGSLVILDLLTVWTLAQVKGRAFSVDPVMATLVVFLFVLLGVRAGPKRPQSSEPPSTNPNG